MSFDIEFKKSGRGKAQCPPDPAYPNGIAIDARTDQNRPSCVAEFPYPAPECGAWLATCRKCQQTVACTAAGRPDDPISMRINCNELVN